MHAFKPIWSNKALEKKKKEFIFLIACKRMTKQLLKGFK